MVIVEIKTRFDSRYYYAGRSADEIFADPGVTPSKDDVTRVIDEDEARTLNLGCIEEARRALAKGGHIKSYMLYTPTSTSATQEVPAQHQTATA